MNSESSIVAESDLTPFFTDGMKERRVIDKARLVERTDGSKAIEVKFYDHLPQTERNIRMLMIGEKLIKMCDEMEREGKEENKSFLDFMDGVILKEWEEH